MTNVFSIFCRPAVRLFAASAFALLAAGCGGQGTDRVQTFPVEGQVKFEGKPMANAFVVLHPKQGVDPKVTSARGQTDEQGNFKVSTYDSGDGAPLGEYSVTIEYCRIVKTAEGYSRSPNLLPAKYSSPQSTILTARVAEGTNKLEPFDLRR